MSKPVLYDTDLEQPPSANRLRAMIDALSSGAEIDASLRAEIIEALKRHEVRRANDKLRHARGIGIAYSTWFAAAIAKELIDRRGATPVKAAITAAAKSAKYMRGQDPKSITAQDFAAVKKAYEKLNKSADGYISTRGGGKFGIVNISDAWLNDAAARLAGDANIGSGAPPSSMGGIIVLLTDPIDDQPKRNK